MDSSHDKRLTHRSVGQFNRQSWIDEGDGLSASAIKTREAWITHRQSFSQTMRQPKSVSVDRAQIWSLLTGLPRASMLLLAYSVEMYLKAGLTKAYHGCSEQMFDRDIRRRFSHGLVDIAKEIDYPIAGDDQTHLNLLIDMLRSDARYPIHVLPDESHADKTNQRTEQIWSAENFEAFQSLAARIRKHSQNLDSDPENPAHFMSRTIDQDGYLAFRYGGNLRPRITYRLSSAQKHSCRTSSDDVRALFVAPEYQQLRKYWTHALIYNDGETKTFLVCNGDNE